MRTVIVDLDGTLCNCGWRENLIPDWDDFHAQCHKDPPFQDVIDLVNSLQDVEVIIMTARPERYRAKTVGWLEKHGVQYDQLFMRGDLDYGTTMEVKGKMLADLGAGTDVWFVLEDRDRVVAWWRSLGITCFQTKQGTY